MRPHFGGPPSGNRSGDDFDILELEQQSVEDLMEIRYLTEENSVFSRTPGGFLSLTYDGKTYSRVAIHRAFPFTDPKKYISIRESDPKAREIGMIEDLSKMSKETQKMLQEQINMRYFTPQITKVNSVNEEYGYTYFDVVTDRGDCRFTIHMNSSAVSKLTDSRVIITDIDGNRFEIPDLNKLTLAERRKLDMYV